MIQHFSKTRDKRKARTRQKMHGTPERPRVAIFRSHQNIYAQIIDDEKMVTLVGLSEKHLENAPIKKIERAHALGKLLAEKAVEKKIKTIVFDRSGYTYHGRIKALADGMREGGLQF